MLPTQEMTGNFKTAENSISIQLEHYPSKPLIIRRKQFESELLASALELTIGVLDGVW